MKPRSLVLVVCALCAISATAWLQFRQSSPRVEVVQYPYATVYKTVLANGDQMEASVSKEGGSGVDMIQIVRAGKRIQSRFFYRKPNKVSEERFSFSMAGRMTGTQSFVNGVLISETKHYFKSSGLESRMDVFDKGKLVYRQIPRIGKNGEVVSRDYYQIKNGKMVFDYTLYPSNGIIQVIAKY